MRSILGLSLSFLFIVACAAIAGCDESDGNDADPSSGGACSVRTEPDACAAASLPASCKVLDEQLAPGDNCASDKRCDVVLDEPDEIRIFSFSLWEYDPETKDSLDADLVAARKGCVEAWLDALDLKYSSSDLHPRFTVETSYSNIAPLLEWSATVDYQVECTEGGCEHCINLDESACSDDPFCSVESGSPYDDADACWSASQFAACLPGTAYCDDAEGTARGPDGTCWRFPSLCYPEGFDYGDDECEALSSEENSQALCE